MSNSIPFHLKKYLVEQDYSRYTSLDQAVWRYIMRQLKNHLSKWAHPCYLDGLKKTGIDSERIPSIAEISACLEKFGWQAAPVSGFIPPAAFMELQSLGVLPIAADMRTLEHLTYTPAPDIVHEAAGHAPILIDPEFSNYLRKYAQVARKAIINKDDLDLYLAIRELSDLKENPSTTEQQIKDAYQRLEETKNKMSDPSEAALLARMNWWTAEYGLVGNLDKPLIYGAGLLSSVGESRTCLGKTVKKIPFSLECIEFSYDITEPQPQLFVSESFEMLSQAIDEIAETMAFWVGGIEGLNKALTSQTVNTVELNSGIQISGLLKSFLTNAQTKSANYLNFEGPTQLCYSDMELEDHSTKRHAHGFGTVVDFIGGKCLSQIKEKDLSVTGIHLHQKSIVNFDSGIKVEGTPISTLRKNGQLVIITWKDCRVEFKGQLLFDPQWGEYDMAVGSKVVSVFGGAADREKYGETVDFVARKVEIPPLKGKKKELNELFARIRAIREMKSINSQQRVEIQDILSVLDNNHQEDWLLRLEVLELSHHHAELQPLKSGLEKKLKQLASDDSRFSEAISDGVQIASQL